MDALDDLLSQEFVHGYASWKVRRKRTLQEMEPVLLSCSDEQLSVAYQHWSSMILQQVPKDDVQMIMKITLVLSVLCRFIRDPVIAEMAKPFIESAMQSKDRTIVKILGKMSYCFIHQCSAKRTVLEMFGFGNDINSWLQTKETLFKGLAILVYSLKLGSSEAIKCFTDNFEVISETCHSEDRELQALAVRTVLIYAKIVKLSTGQEILHQIIEDCVRGLNVLDTERCYLVVKEISQLHEIFHSSVMDSDPKPILDSVLGVCGRCAAPTDLAAAEFFLKIVCDWNSEVDLPEMTNLFLKKGNKFIPIVAKMVDIFGSKLDLEAIAEWSAGFPCDACEDFCPFVVGKAVLAAGGPLKLQNCEHICRHFVECVKMHEYVLPDKLLTAARGVLENRNSSDEESMAVITLSGMFPLKFAESLDEYVDVIASYQNDTRVNVRIECMRVLGSIDTPQSMERLLIAARSDSDKRVRLEAVKSMKPSPALAAKAEFLELLYDPSFKVRRKALKLVPVLSEFNPLDIVPFLTDFGDVANQSIRNSSDMRLASRFGSLYPNLCTALSTRKSRDVLVEAVLSLCLNLLNHYWTEKCSLADFDDNSSDVIRVSKMRKSKIEKICTAKYVKLRDVYLIKALANLGKLCQPHLTQILFCFSRILKHSSADPVLLATVEALIKLSACFFNGLNIRLQCPRILKYLLNIMRTTYNKELSVATLKLLGGSFDSYELFQLRKEKPQSIVNDDLSSSQYLVVIDKLFKSFPEPSLPVLRALAVITEHEANAIAGYLAQVIRLFAAGINSCLPTAQNQIFGYMEVIPAKLPIELAPHLPDLLILIKNHLDMASCVRFCCSICYYLRFQLSSFIQSLFPELLLRVSACDIVYFKEAVKCVSLMVVKQTQYFEFFLDVIDKRNWAKEYMEVLIECLAFIAISIPCTPFLSRLTILILRFAGTGAVVEKLYLAVLFALKKTPNSDASAESFLKAVSHLNCEKLDCDESFFSIYTYQATKCDQSSLDGIDSMEVPQPKQEESWFNSFTHLIIRASPSPVIRACEHLPFRNDDFIKKIFPLAFLSCWKVMTKPQRKKMATIFNGILSRDSLLTEQLVSIVEILEHMMVPMKIDKMNLVRRTKSYHFSLFFLENLLAEDPTNCEVIQRLLETQSRFSDSDPVVRGTFGRYGHLLPKQTQAKWLGYLNSWKEACEIYEKEGPLTKLMKCYRQLGKYDKVIEHEQDFWHASEREQAQLHSVMLWAFSISNQKEKVNELLNVDCRKYLSWNGLGFLGMIYYELKTSRMESAQNLINDGFESIHNRRWVFGTDDYRAMNSLLNLAQILVEAQESIKSAQASDIEILKEKWQLRVSGFKRDSLTWDRFITIRNFIIPIAENMSDYVKIIAALRKGEKYSVIKRFFAPFFNRSPVADTLFERIKLLDAMGHTNDAVIIADSWACTVENYRAEKILQKMLSLHCVFFQESWLWSCLEDTSAVPGILAKCKGKFGSADKKEIYNSFAKLPVAEQKEFVQTIIDDNWSEVYAIGSRLFAQLSFDEHFQDRLFRTAGKLISRQYNTCPQLKRAVHYYEKALELSPTDVRNWKGWAYCNSSLYHLYRTSITAPEKKVGNTNSESTLDYIYDFPHKSVSGCVVNPFNSSDITPLSEVVVDYDSPIPSEAFGSCVDEDHTVYAENAIKGFMKSVELSEGDSLSSLCQLFSILFSLDSSKSIDASIWNYINALSDESAVKVVPQMTAQVWHPDPTIRAFISKGLISIAENVSFEEIYFALAVLATSDDVNPKVTQSREIRSVLQKMNPELAEECDLFHDGLVRSAETWFELWLRVIEQAAKVDALEGRKESFQLLRKYFPMLDHPRCEFDSVFLQAYGRGLKTLEARMNDMPDSVWSHLKVLYESIKTQVSKLSCVVLSTVSEALAQKTNFKVRMPRNFDDERIRNIEGVLDVLGTQQRPRCLYIVSEKGTKKKFLLKGNEDLRLDQRIMQFFSLVNNVITHDRRTRELNSEICLYEVIPLKTTTGLISWVTNATTFQEVVTDWRKIKGIDQQIEHYVISGHTKGNVAKLNSLQKLELYYHARDVIPNFGMDLANMFWLTYQSAENWYEVRRTYTVSTAIMSIVGYIIGLGDRHPSNIMFQRGVGNAIHIDFGDCFEKAQLRSMLPERVPFRLTTMMVNALDSRMTDGLFDVTCGKVLTVLRANQHALISQLSIFVHEPIVASSNLHEDGHNCIQKCYRKLMGLEQTQKQEPVKAQVERLIRQATDPMNYMQHYQGWCPLW